MKNYIKAYLISVLILDGVYFFYFVSPYLKAIPAIYDGYIPSHFILEPLLTMLKITVRFVALMFVFVVPFFKLVIKYPRASWVIVFMAGFLLYFFIFLIGQIAIRNLSIMVFYANILSAVVFASIFSSLFWWLNRGQKHMIKNIIDDFS